MAHKPQRIAPPAIIADAASALYGQVDASSGINEEQRPLWVNAVTKAFNQLVEGVRFERQHDGTFVFPSRTRSGVAHRVNGVCDCEATAEQGQPCWHRAAKRLVLLVEKQQSDVASRADQPLHDPDLVEHAAIPATGKYMMIDPDSGDIALFYDGELVGFAENDAVAKQLLQEYLDQKRVQQAEAAAPPPAPLPPALPAHAGPGRSRLVGRNAPARSAQEEIDELFEPKM